jgi:hypothetical protein
MLMASAAPAQAELTKVIIRAQSTDAKFIGTSMGGVKITLRDAKSGKILAQGVTAGGTGDTKRLVTEPRLRGAPLADANSAKVELALDISRPTLVRAEAFGPLAKPHSAVTVVSTAWLIPGRPLPGDGWILPFPGLVVEPDLVGDREGNVEVSAKVTLMCGCPLDANGVWDAKNYQVTARLFDGKREVARKDLAFTGKTSVYAAAIPDVKPGNYRLEVTAADSATVNAGMGEKRVSVRR